MNDDPFFHSSLLLIVLIVGLAGFIYIENSPNMRISQAKWSELAGVNQAQEKSTASSTSYAYTIVTNADPCTLNTMGAQGWNEIQIGGTLVLASGGDENCRNQGHIYNSLDWAMFAQIGSASSSNYRYKIVSSTDPCTLNLLGKQGWIVQEVSGDDLTSTIGSDGNCKRAGAYDGFDWVLMQKDMTASSTYEYALIRDADPCTLTTFGATNWSAVANSGLIEPALGADQNCRSRGSYNDLTWTLFVRNTTPAATTTAPQ